jgi:hypothetical protein
MRSATRIDPSGENFFAVNLFSPLESNIRPVENLQTSDGPLPPTRTAELGQREFWPWLAGFALAVLVLEWLIAQRRLIL